MLRKTGLRVIFPFYGTKCVSLRLNNFESPSVKVARSRSARELPGCRVADAESLEFDPQDLLAHLSSVSKSTLKLR